MCLYTARVTHNLQQTAQCIHTDMHLNEALRGIFHLLQKRFHNRCGRLFSLVWWVMSWGRPGEEGVTGLACVCLNKCFCVMFIQNHCCSIMELKATSVLLLVCVTIIILTSTKGQDHIHLTPCSKWWPCFPLYVIDATCKCNIYNFYVSAV